MHAILQKRGSRVKTQFHCFATIDESLLAEPLGYIRLKAAHSVADGKPRRGWAKLLGLAAATLRSYRFRKCGQRPLTRKRLTVDITPLLDRAVSDAGRWAWLALSAFSNADGLSYAAILTMARRIGKSPRTIQYGLAELEKTGYLERQSWAGSTPLYRLIHKELIPSSLPLQGCTPLFGSPFAGVARLHPPLFGYLRAFRSGRFLLLLAW